MTNRREPASYRPSPEDVRKLIESAHRHPLGVDYLKHGEPGSVAATFRAHAFTVDAAREHLARSTR